MKKKMKAWLKPNPLTLDESDYIAVIENFGSIDPKGIIKELVAEGMELKPETVLDVITRYHRKCIEMVLGGYNVNTGIMYMHPMIKGVFRDKTWNPEQNRLYISITQGMEIRNAIANTKVEIMGEHPDVIALFNITDLSTGNTTGMLTRGLNAELKGTYIRIAGNDPACGIYFRNTDSGVEIKVESRYIAVNDPSHIIFIVPQELEEGTYEVQITTQFSKGNKALKQPRSVILPYMVEIN
jgi:hypothetical protein